MSIQNLPRVLISLIGFSLIMANIVRADPPPAWTEFQVQSANGRFTAEIAIASAESGKYKLIVYDTGSGAKREMWSTDYQYDGYPGGLLTDDGSTFVDVKTWYSEDMPLVTIYGQGRTSPVQLWIRDFNLDPAALQKTVSHQLWLADGLPYQLTSTTQLELNTRDGKKHVVDFTSGKVIPSKPGDAPVESDNKSCAFLTDCGWEGGFPVSAGGCGCFSKKYITAVRQEIEKGNYSSQPFVKCDGPPYPETACLCVEGICQPDLLTKYEGRIIPQTRGLDIAKKLCQQEGYEWKDASIEDAGDAWLVHTGGLQDGGNADILIDKTTGKILNKHFNPE